MTVPRMSKVELENAKYRRQLEDYEREVKCLNRMLDGLGIAVSARTEMVEYSHGWDDCIRAVRKALLICGLEYP